MIITKAELKSFIDAKNTTPHTFLGMHKAKKGRSQGLVVRAFVRDAAECFVVDLDATPKKGPAIRHEMTRLAPEGFFEVFIPRKTDLFRYQIRAILHNGETRQFYDPYSFLPTVGELDLYLFNEGNDHFIYKKLGAHLREIGGVPGVSFAVWAPGAARVSVVGNFNHWDGRYHPMRALGASGVWEIFIPGLREGDLYKFEIRDQQGDIRLKTDPYGTYFEAPPNNASIVCDTRRHQWADDAWMEKRRAAAGQLDQPLSIYEVHLGSWKRKVEDANRPFSYRELAPMLADYVTEMGFTHIEVMPLAEHPFDGSWGYQVTGFYAPTQRFGTPHDFAYFVDYLHQRDIGIILDWVPAHFPRDSFALAEFDGTHLYEHADPRQGAHMDWGTLIFNYGRNEVRCFLAANALSWFDRYHIDGLRVDAVASMLYLDYSRKEGEWIPNKFGGRENLEAIDFLRMTNDLVHQYYPGGVMIAEESTSFAGVSRPTKDGGLGFDYKWNMGWMHDTLRFFQKEPIHRKWHQNDLTFGMLYQYAENFITVFSHDEVTHGKASLLFKMGAWHIADKAANLRALYGHMWGWPGKKLLFMGGEFGQSGEWNHAASLDWHLRQWLDHEGIRLLVRDLNKLYRDEPVLSRNDFNNQGFRWISCNDADASVIAFQRNDPFGQDIFLVVGHFTPVPRPGYRIGVPRAGFWKEVLNTNSQYYGGTGVGNNGGRATDPIPGDGHSQSLLLTLPPQTTSIFKWSAKVD
ncbi:1,4-alpha-glucan branching protein GlgB [Termitidicoccus mucosus]|uniref:1,4-alpha-glucan branching enzyme GlgB n=1 Tax=Termitidicoccus mucosus TaxID=1184151 RepID=A0A178ICJ4_9BACT|nr:glycogen-branching enzyme [Opitutaceae bacterium TSB47]